MVAIEHLSPRLYTTSLSRGKPHLHELRPDHPPVDQDLPETASRPCTVSIWTSPKVISSPCSADGAGEIHRRRHPLHAGETEQRHGQRVRHDLDREPYALKRCLGVVPQEFNSTGSRRCRHRRHPGGLLRYSALDRQARAEQYLTQLGLWEKRDVASRELSGGMRSGA